MRSRAGVALSLGVLLALVACGAPGPQPGGVRLRAPDAAVTVLGGASPAELALATSAALVVSAPAAVLAADPATGATLAQEHRLPLLLLPGDGAPAVLGAVRAELDRLGAGAVLAADDVAEDRVEAWGGRSVVTDSADLPERGAPDPPPDLTVLVAGPVAGPGASGPAGAATARAAGLVVRVVPDGDPRADAGLHGVPRPGKVLAIGTEFGSAARLDARLAVAAAGRKLPGGGQLLFPGRRIVALYGHPGTAALGVLGEQPVDAAVQRARAVATGYATTPGDPVVPAFELIATIASSAPGPDGNYSAEADPALLRPWVDAAEAAGMYVVLDLQPGRADFLTQARRYADLLARPHVGLALDPEWRLGPGERPLQRIGSVTVEEVNAVAAWLADLTRDGALPQKLLVLHQFRLEMIAGRERLDTSRDEIAVLLHADGFGSPGDKLATWDALHTGAPPGVVWGWKNFYDEDVPPFTPRQTVQVAPEPPVFVSYQ